MVGPCRVGLGFIDLLPVIYGGEEVDTAGLQLSKLVTMGL